MKLYTVSHQGRTLVCRAEDGALRVLPYESMNALLTDDPARRNAALPSSPRGRNFLRGSADRVPVCRP